MTPRSRSAVAVTAGLSEQPPLQDRLGVVLPRGEGHGSTVGQHDHDAGADGRDRLEELDLCGGQVHRGAVVPFGLPRRGQPEEDDGHLSVGGGNDSFLTQDRVAGVGLDDVPGGEHHLTSPVEGRREGVQGGVETGRVDLRGAGALVARGPGHLTDDGDRAGTVGVERQQAPLVLQQDRAGRGRFLGQGMVGVGVDRADGDRASPQGAVGQGEHAGGGQVDVRLGERARPDGIHDDAGPATAAGGHLQVEPSSDRGVAAVDRTPVGDDQPVEPPLLAQDGGQQPRVLRGVDPVDPVVRAHDRPRLGGGDDPLERRKVDLAQGAFVDVGRDRHPVGLLVVRGEVLQGRAHPLRLDALHDGGGQLAGEVRVLGEVLEVAAAQR